MSIHIKAQEGQIAETVLFPGDPLRAKWIAEKFLTDVIQYNAVRNMLGFTGTTTDGRRISVQGSGMGMPSLSIYATELFRDYKVKNIVRVGSAGAFSKDVPCRSIVIASGACSDSALNHRRFYGMNFAPVASWGLLKKADTIASELNIPVLIGNIVSVDKFYEDVEPHTWKIFDEYGVLAVEMETAELYTLAAKYKANALTIVTISDNLLTEEKLGPDERESTFADMMKIAISL